MARLGRRAERLLRLAAADVLERVQKRSAPCERIMGADPGKQRAVALLALLQAHLERDLDGIGHLLDVVGIDDQRLLHLLGRARKARKNEDARIVGVLGRHELLCHEVHAVAQRGDEADARLAVDIDEHPARRRAVDVLDRHPVELAELAVDRPRQRLELLANVDIGHHALPRGRRDLRKDDLAAIVGVLLQKASERAELLRQPLGVVEPVDADEAGYRGRLIARALGARFDEGVDVDAHGEAGNRQLAIKGPDPAVLKNAAEHAILQIVDEIGDVGLRLQSDEIVGGKAAGEIPVLGDREKCLRGGNGNVQEEPDRIVDAELAQLHAEGDHVIVVHPDGIVGLQERTQRVGKALVDVEIALVVAGLELRQVEPRVKHRPQHGVGIPEIVFLVLAVAERKGGNGRRIGLRDVGGRAQLLALFAGLAAPTQPQAVSGAQNVGDGDHHAPSLRRLAQVGDAVGDQDDPAHSGAPSYAAAHYSSIFAIAGGAHKLIYRTII